MKSERRQRRRRPLPSVFLVILCILHVPFLVRFVAALSQTSEVDHPSSIVGKGRAGQVDGHRRLTVPVSSEPDAEETKVAASGRGKGSRRRGLLISRPPEAAPVNYGGNHPFGDGGRASQGRAPADSAASGIGGREREAGWGHNGEGEATEYRPLRIAFVEDSTRRRRVDNNGSSGTADAEAEQQLSERQIRRKRARMAAFLGEVLPAAADLWSSALSVVPVVGNLTINAATAVPTSTTTTTTTEHVTSSFGRADAEGRSGGGHAICPEVGDHATAGVPNADMVVYYSLAAEDEDCGGNGGEGGASYGFPCELDQHDRPIGGTLDFCLESLRLNRSDGVTSRSLRRAVVSVSRELGHVLGMHPELFKFFRDPHTGRPLTPRPFRSSVVSCVGPSGRKEWTQMPACNTLREGMTGRGARYYEVVTPTVAEVARNQFGCRKVRGARLENQPPGEDGICFGYDWEARLFAGELMSPSQTSLSPELSPLTLALLEDSGWYRANYGAAKVSPFGLGAGCDFVFGDCIVGGNDKGNGSVSEVNIDIDLEVNADAGVRAHVPAHSKGFFCDSPLNYNVGLGRIDGTYSCDASHGFKSLCNLVDYDMGSYFSGFGAPPPEEFQHFAQRTYGSLARETDFCPVSSLATKSISCEDAARSPIFQAAIESYGSGSKCFNTLGSESKPLCLSSRCNEEERSLEVFAGNQTFVCTSDGQTFPLPNDDGAVLECPRLLSVCLDFYCPKNCAGRGVCDSYAGRCQCFDASDDSPTCSKSRIQAPSMALAACGDSPHPASGATRAWSRTFMRALIGSWTSAIFFASILF